MDGDHVPHHLGQLPADAVLLARHVRVVEFDEALIELGRMTEVLDPLRAIKRLITGMNDRLELRIHFRIWNSAYSRHMTSSAETYVLLSPIVIRIAQLSAEGQARGLDQFDGRSRR